MRGLKPLDIGGEKMQLIKRHSGDSAWGSLELKWQQSNLAISATEIIYLFVKSSLLFIAEACVHFFLIEFTFQTISFIHWKKEEIIYSLNERENSVSFVQNQLNMTTY